MYNEIMQDTTVFWLFIICAAHFTSYLVFRHSGPFKEHPWLATHQLCSLLCIGYCAYNGTKLWFSNALNSVQDRLYDYNDGGATIVKVNLAFQMFDFVTTLLVKDMAQRNLMIFHHFMAGMLAFLGTYYSTYLHYYAIFFMGVSELSGVPLVFVDLFSYFPKLAAKAPLLDLMSKALFAVLFITVRLVMWPILSLQYWTDVITSLVEGRSHSLAVVLVFLASNIFLTVLQFYWGTLVFKGIVDVLKSFKQSKKTTESHDIKSK